MTTAKKLALHIFEAFRDDDIDRIGEAVHEDFVDHGAPPWAPGGRAGYLRIMRFLKETLELRYEMHEIVAEGDLVAARATVHGRHNANTTGFPATGRPFAMPTMHLFRADGGLLAEHWGVRDELSVLWQVGALPPPQPVAL